MKIISKRYNKVDILAWDYCEIIQYNNTEYERYNLVNQNTKNNWFKYNSGASMFHIINDKDHTNLEKVYQNLIRKDKLKNILNENY
jgi:hypothetical protein